MNNSGIQLRKFPFPFQCALAISSDIDNAASQETFTEIMEYFNTESDTVFGRGLGLEVGNSFWFFSNSNRPQLSYFDGLTMDETSFAPIIRNMWQSGHIDTLHSWGNFDLGGFTRSIAQMALKELQKYHATIPVWVNHGIGLNHQKVGNYPNMFGDDPSHKAYHLDLAIKAGCEFFWTGKVTHVIGQESEMTFSVQSKLLIQWLMKRTRYRHVVDPIYDDGNQLFFPIQFRDQTRFWEFIRFMNSWGKEQVLDIHDLATQLSPSILNQLIKNRGFMILYTHFNEHVNMNGLPAILTKNLSYLKKKNIEGDIFIATSSRLLKYKELHDYLNFKVDSSDGMINIYIDSTLETPIGSKSLARDQLCGLTFYVDHPPSTRIWFQKKKIEIEKNPKDESGKLSVMIPWEKLSYPN